MKYKVRILYFLDHEIFLASPYFYQGEIFLIGNQSIFLGKVKSSILVKTFIEMRCYGCCKLNKK